MGEKDRTGKMMQWLERGEMEKEVENSGVKRMEEKERGRSKKVVMYEPIILLQEIF